MNISSIEHTTKRNGIWFWSTPVGVRGDSYFMDIVKDRNTSEGRSGQRSELTDMDGP